MARGRVFVLVAVAAIAGVAAAAAPAVGEMQSTQLDRHLCETVGGGRFVNVPEFPGEKLDRRLLPDLRWMEKRFHVFLTDGYSTDPVHAPNGEHPIGLATDLVPNKSQGGTWGMIGQLAHLAEPRQDHPIAPWRWVGYNGDPGHGRGNHLHLSWMHSKTKPKVPARTVYTRICPAPPTGKPAARRAAHGPTGGVHYSGHESLNGGVTPHGRAKLAPAVPEKA